MSSVTKPKTEFIDPVCGMKVDPDTAAGSYEQDGRTYYFCSKACLNKFRQDPESFTGGVAEPEKESGVGESAASNTYTCPMHPEVREEGPGSCPECGMALEPLK